ncbi:Ribonuclease R [bioreactor metagenome]|uniref:Ribonuclease R n=1 Tax=bioreactor metagenome TaxID=1076179 RepID=A0A645DL73_9ZZZZ
MSNPKEIFSFLDDSRVSKDDRLIREVFIRILEKAIYSPQNIGHFGMASEAYLHFTSPIRRYSDLYIHRIIKNFLNGNMEQINCMEQQLKLICSRCNENERIEVKTKSEVFKYKISEFMADKIGNKYTGVIAAVTDKGIYVDIMDYIRGFIHVDYFNSDRLYYDEILHAYRSKENEAEIYTYGTEINVKVEKIIPKTNTIILGCV